MAKGMYHYIKEAWKNQAPEILRKRMEEWRDGDAVTKVEKPLRLDRARTLGYKAKPGFIVARVKLMRGGRRRPRTKAGRQSGNQTIRKTLLMNYQWVAEQRAAKRFINLEVLNSYLIGKDGTYAFYEVIMVDPKHPQIIADKDINWICNERGRVFHGRTSAARKSRGLRARGNKRMKR